MSLCSIIDITLLNCIYYRTTSLYFICNRIPGKKKNNVLIHKKKNAILYTIYYSSFFKAQHHDVPKQNILFYFWCLPSTNCIIKSHNYIYIIYTYQHYYIQIMYREKRGALLLLLLSYISLYVYYRV